MTKSIIPEFKTAIALNSNWSEVYDLADTYRNQQQWQKAAIALQRAIALRPDFFWSYHHLGDVLSKLQQWQKAVMVYRRAIELDPNFFWSYHNLADALSKLQKWDKAIANYLQAVFLQPDHKLTYQKLGTAFKQRGSREESIHYYRQLINSPQPNSIFSTLANKPQLILDIAQALTREHQTLGAIILYYLVLEIQPDQPQVLLQLSQLLQKQKQFEANITSRLQKLKHDSPSQLLTRLETNPTPKQNHQNISGQIVIQTKCPIAPNQLEDLCRSVGWASRPLEKVKQALNNSFSYVAAWQVYEEEQRLIGFARAVSDGTFQATLLDIVVHPNFQGRGIGKELVNKLIEQLCQAEIEDITLFASPHIVDFYHKLGFISQPNNLQWMLWYRST